MDDRLVSNGGYPFAGSLAEVRIFNGRLTHPEIAALPDCGAPAKIRLPANSPGYLVPLYRATVEPLPGATSDSEGFSYIGFGKGGAEFASPNSGCSLSSLIGTALPSNLRIHADILLPTGTEAGPFFRAHRVRPGDPIEGPGFGGFWLRMNAMGGIAVYSLSRPEGSNERPFATGESPVAVHPGEWHAVEAEARGPVLRAWVDGQAVRFRALDKTNDPVAVLGLAAESAPGIGVEAPPIPTDGILVRSIRVSEAR